MKIVVPSRIARWNPWSTRRLLRLAPILAAACGLLVIIHGCTEPRRKPSTAAQKLANQTTAQADLFTWVADNVSRLEEIEPGPAFEDAADRLNQWVNREEPTIDWEADKLISQLPPEIAELPNVKSLGDLDFSPLDTGYLQEAIWLRDISQSARAGEFDDLVIAERLFDWTIRNIQLEPDPTSSPASKGKAASAGSKLHTPRELLLIGRGTAAERAWIFILLARQQGLDAVLLAFPGSDEEPSPRPWLPAVLIDNELYLFDVRLGLPIMAPGVARVARLSEAAADDTLLRALDLEATEPYSVKSGDLDDLVALVEASPNSLSKRMKLVESLLAGKQKLRLRMDAAALAEKLNGVAHVGSVRLWLHPYEVLLNRSRADDSQTLWLARESLPFRVPIDSLKKGSRGSGADDFSSMTEGLANPLSKHATPDGKDNRKIERQYPLRAGRLQHFRGNYTGENGAKQRYMTAQPDEQTIEDSGKVIKAYRKRQTDQGAAERADKLELLLAGTIMMKQAATLWLGLITYEEKHYSTAIHYLKQFNSKNWRDSPWANGARYNLARAYELDGKPEEAIKLYEADQSPQRFGNRLRARRLKEAQPAAENR